MTRVTHYNVIPLGGDGTGFVYGISDDGLKVCGLQNSDSSLFFWSAGTGTLVISYPTGINFGSFQDNRGGFSRDGSTVVGTVFDGVGGNAPFYWNQSTGVNLISIPAPYTKGAACAVNHDGTVIVGQFTTNGSPGSPGYHLRTFIWSSGITTVLSSAFSAEETIPNLLSNDGTTIVGSTGVNDGYQMWRWTSGSGFGLIGSGYTASQPNAVSADGLTIVGGVGDIDTITITEGFVWTSGAGYNTIGWLPGDNTSVLFSVSLDGSKATGYSTDGSTQRGILCTVSGPTLTDLGAYNNYSQGVSISGDGTTIILDGASPAFGNNAQLWNWVSGTKTDLVVESTSGGTTTGPLCDWTFGIAAFFQGVSNNGGAFIGAYGNGHGLFPFIWTTATVECECGGFNVPIEGVFATAQIGTISKKADLELSHLGCTQFEQPAYDRNISMRYSNDKGATWSNQVLQSSGDIGEGLTNIQFQRLGISRDRVFEISWSGNFKTAITGVFIGVTKSGS